MSINKKIFTETAETIAANYGLMQDVIKVMTKCDGVAPVGACCGKNNLNIAEKFISNIKKYKDIMEQIDKRTIKPIKSGIVYISPIKKMINISLLTDSEIVKYVDKGYLRKDRFDWSEYEKQKATTEPESENVQPKANTGINKTDDKPVKSIKSKKKTSKK